MSLDSHSSSNSYTPSDTRDLNVMPISGNSSLVLTGRTNAEVYFRIFPMENTQWDLVKVESSTIFVKSIQDLTSKDPKFWEFKCDGVFCNTSQENVYSLVAAELVERIVEGYSGIIIGFGQTGTGKTFTLSGLQYTQQECGIAPRVIFDLFKLKSELPKNIMMTIEMCYTEFSKLCVIDLLKEYPNIIDQWHVKNTSKIKVNTEYEALKLLYLGEGRKTFANNDTYMSHLGTTVLTFHVAMSNLDFTSPEKVSSRLHIIDLAGVDSAGNTSSSFKSAVDIGHANMILSYLRQFIMNLTENIPRNIEVKERTNPLIYYLGNDLSNQSILRFIGHIRIQEADLRITISMLKFGQLARGLKPKLKKIEPEINEEVKLKHLQYKLDCLQKENVHSSVLMNQDLTLNLSQGRMAHIQSTVEAYVNNHINELNVLNVVEATEAFKILKSMCPVYEEKIKTTSGPDARSSSKCSIKVTKSLSKKIKTTREESFASAGHSKPKQTRKSVSRLSINATSKSKTHKLKSIRSLVSVSQTQLATKKPVLGSANKRGSVTTKPSTNTSIKEKVRKESKITLDSTILPDILPEYRDVWNTFCTDPKSQYKVLFEAFKTNENKIKYVYMDYLKEVKELRECKENAEKKEMELLESKMFCQYSSLPDKHDELMEETEKICQENFNDARTRLFKQQEITLKIQTELKMFLDYKNKIKQDMRDQFDAYCKENFNTLVFDTIDDELLLTEEPLDIDIKLGEDGKDGEYNKCLEKSLQSSRLEKLKRIMKRELQKNIKLKEIKSKQWKDPI